MQGQVKGEDSRKPNVHVQTVSQSSSDERSEAGERHLS